MIQCYHRLTLVKINKFLKENKSIDKIYTVRHLFGEKVPMRIIYGKLKRCEHFQAQRANGSGKIAKKDDH